MLAIRVENIGKKLTLDDIGFSLPEINKPFYFSIKDEKGNIYYYFIWIARQTRRIYLLQRSVKI